MIFSIFRYVLVGLGFVSFLLAFLSFSNDVGPFSLERLPDMPMSFLSIEWDLIIFFVILGYVFFVAGFYWRAFFKKMASFSVFVAVFLMTFAIFLYPVHISSEEIADSIQPTIDYVAATSFDDMFNSEIEVYDEPISLVMSENSEVMRVYVKNVTNNQADYLTSQLGISLSTQQERVAISKMVITSIYQEIVQNSPGLRDVPIPLSQVRQIASAEIDLSLVESVDVALLENMFSYDDNAYLDVLISSGTKTLVVNPSSVSEDEVNALWDSLGLNANTSFESRKNLIVLLLSASAAQIGEASLGIPVSIPVDMVKHAMPEEVIYMMGTEIMSDNISLRVDALEDLREYCSARESEAGYACTGIMMTDYENLMAVLQGKSSEVKDLMAAAGVESENLMMGHVLDIEGISTLDKVEKKIDSMSSLAGVFFWGSLSLLLFAHVLIFVHYKVNSKFFGKFELFYEISKMNFLGYLSTFIFIVVIWYMFSSGALLNLLSSLLGSAGMDDSIIGIFEQLPVYDVIMSINAQVLLLSIIYFVFSAAGFACLYFLNKKYPSLEELESGNDDENPESFDGKADEQKGKGKGGVKTNKIDNGVLLDEEEVRAKNYIERYCNKYSREALAEALEGSGIKEVSVKRYLDKYY